MSHGPYIVVVGMDFSTLADGALTKAYELAVTQPRAEIHVVSVLPAESVDYAYPLSGFAVLDPARVVSVEDTAAQLHAHVELVLGRIPKRPGQSVRVVSHVRLDTPALGISALAAELEAQLIVLGTHGHHGVARWLLGSVAEAVVRHAGCPVLVIPPEPTASLVPKIEPLCPECVSARRASAGKDLWCEHHRQRHGRRHTYHQADRVGAETNLPLTVR